MLVPEDIVSFESGDVTYTVGFEVSMIISMTHISHRIDGEWYLVQRHADFPHFDRRG